MSPRSAQAQAQAGKLSSSKLSKFWKLKFQHQMALFETPKQLGIHSNNYFFKTKRSKIFNVVTFLNFRIHLELKNWFQWKLVFITYIFFTGNWTHQKPNYLSCRHQPKTFVGRVSNHVSMLHRQNIIEVLVFTFPHYNSHAVISQGLLWIMFF